MKATVLKCEFVSKDVFSLNFNIPTPLNAKPGKFVFVSIPNHAPRAYSIVCEEDNVITLGIKVQKSTSYAMSKLKPGDLFEIKGPYGSFVPRDANRVVLVGGGIGVTPLVSLYRYYKSINIPVDVFLSSRGDFVFSDYFDSPVLFNTAVQRRIVADDIPKDSLVYICGPKTMITNLRQDLIARGHDSKHIFSEEFV